MAKPEKTPKSVQTPKTDDFTDLKVGIEGFSITVEIPNPARDRVAFVRHFSPDATDEQVEAYVNKCFARGARIDVQEGSGARDIVKEMVAGKGVAERASAEFLNSVRAAVRNALEDYDLVAERKRGGRPQTPKTVAVDENKMYTPAQMQEILLAAGIKNVTFVPKQ